MDKLNILERKQTKTKYLYFIVNLFIILLRLYSFYLDYKPILKKQTKTTPPKLATNSGMHTVLNNDQTSVNVS